MHRLKHRPTRTKAGSLLEFMLILPIFLFLFLLLLDGSRLLLVSGALSDATYRSARAAAVSGGASFGDTANVAFDQAISEIPGASTAQQPTLSVVRGSICSNADPYVEVKADFAVELLTPGLGAMASWITGEPNSSPLLAGGSIRMDKTAVARCEVAQ